MATTYDITHETDLIMTGEAARILGVARETVRRWTEEGILPSQRIGNYRGVRRADVEALAQKRAEGK